MELAAIKARNAGPKARISGGEVVNSEENPKMPARRQAHKRHRFTVEELLHAYLRPLRADDVDPVMDNSATSLRAEKKQPRVRSGEETRPSGASAAG